ncbi:MAG: AbrB/MazE/SpoVT family DNA-binding domain-containing protein [Clostridia bacterium]|nr:AbrB/MazE/SpoVT family DNA-binding domain-containing protein [Clostridia bacterium]
MIKKLTKHGNSAALVIDKPILSLLGATADTSFEVRTNGNSLILTPVRDEEREKRLDEAFEENVKRYKKTFETLAK